MKSSNVTSDNIAQCLLILEKEEGPILAIELAKKLGLFGSHETKRRHVRTLIKIIRDKGIMVVAIQSAGYFFTDDVTVWKDYLDGRQIDAKRILGETGRRKKMVANSKGQGMLFGEAKTMIGKY